MLKRIVATFGAAAVAALVGMLLIEAPIQAQAPGVIIEDALQTALEVPSTNAALIPQGMQVVVYRAVPSTTSSTAYEDPFLQAIDANGEVFGCTDDVSFEKLTLRTPIEELVGFCRPEPVVNKPQRLGVIFWEPPVFDSVEMFANGSFYDPEVDIKPQIGNAVALRYVMETEHGPVKFVWPSPLHEEDYAMFSGPYEKKLELDLRLNPDPPAFSVEETNLLGEPAHVMRASF